MTELAVVAGIGANFVAIVTGIVVVSFRMGQMSKALNGAAKLIEQHDNDIDSLKDFRARLEGLQ